MKKSFIMIIVMSIILTACAAQETAPDTSPTASPIRGHIYLYGEQHGVKSIYDKELELWSDYYHNEGMRHLFVEYPYYSAEFLNIWMKSDDDALLDTWFTELKGTAGATDDHKNFLKQFKTECPETIFHGTDIGHQYNTTGTRYLEYLEENGQQDTPQYITTREVIEQGMQFYRNNSSASEYTDVGGFREQAMTDNFIREFNPLNGENVMGIYGSIHTSYDAPEWGDSMITRLQNYYGDIIATTDLSGYTLLTEPIRVDVKNVNGKEYEASYFGEADTSSWSTEMGFTSREFWRLEDAYDDFKDFSTIENYLPYNNYIMQIKTGQIFMILYHLVGGGERIEYYRSDIGNTYMDLPATLQFVF